MLDFSTSETFDLDDTVWEPSTPERVASLDTLSQRVIALARDEAFRSRPERGAAAHLRRWLLGTGDALRPLANPALDTLRRFSMSVRLGDGESESFAQVLLDKGHYSRAQIEIARGMSR